MEPTAATGNPTYKNIKPVRSIGIMSLSPVTQTDGNKNFVSFIKHVKQLFYLPGSILGNQMRHHVKPSMCIDQPNNTRYVSVVHLVVKDTNT